ncbi:hypothetical protein LIA77_03884 [Sarocladium implicatum]|nr:hypothetical protein LIA77_03884 [Sarocladium implicatum]
MSAADPHKSRECTKVSREDLFIASAVMACPRISFGTASSWIRTLRVTCCAPEGLPCVLRVDGGGGSIRLFTTRSHRPRSDQPSSRLKRDGGIGRFEADEWIPLRASLIEGVASSLLGFACAERSQYGGRYENLNPKSHRDSQSIASRPTPWAMPESPTHQSPKLKPTDHATPSGADGALPHTCLVLRDNATATGVPLAIPGSGCRPVDPYSFLPYARQAGSPSPKTVSAEGSMYQPLPSSVSLFAISRWLLEGWLADLQRTPPSTRGPHSPCYRTGASMTGIGDSLVRFQVEGRNYLLDWVLLTDSGHRCCLLRQRP